MLPPKAFIDVVSAQASRLLSGELPLSPVPRAELEAQFKLLVQGALARLELVSREEFDTQALVLAHTRARLEALESRMAELEQKLAAAQPAD